MSIMWWGSCIPWTKPNGDPHVGATVTFYDEGTSTPQTTYVEASLSNAASLSDRTADSSGIFGPIFLAPGSYRCKVLDSDGAVIRDIDGISVPQTSDYTPPDAGETSVELLARTGDIKARYGTGTHSGWVRMNGRTIGSASSGASERANADCEDLFVFLWDEDSTLAVSGGRGGSATSDWSANKAIALPSARGRALVGLDDMGNAEAGVLPGLTTLGEVVGAATIVLAESQMPSHSHGGTTSSNGLHGHPFRIATSGDSGISNNGALALDNQGQNNYSAYTGTPSATNGQQIGGAGDHTHTFTTEDAGSDAAHDNVQPSMGVTLYIKL